MFAGLPNPFTATRYHSLAVARETLPKVLEVTAWTDDGEIMGHPASRRGRCTACSSTPSRIATEGGHHLLANFLDLAGVKRWAAA